MLGGHHLLWFSGIEYFHSDETCCDHCWQKTHRDGKESCFHRILGVVLVHSRSNFALPLAPELIRQHDGTSKIDYDRNVARRFIENFRSGYPELKAIVIQPGWALTAANVKFLNTNRLRYIICPSKAANRFLFGLLNSSSEVVKWDVWQETDDGAYWRQFRWLNDVPLNKTHLDMRVNILSYEETRVSDSAKQTYSWVTDLPLHETSAMEVMREGRSRWRMNTEIFKTLRRRSTYYDEDWGVNLSFALWRPCQPCRACFTDPQDSGAILRILPACAGVSGNQRVSHAYDANEIHG